METELKLYVEDRGFKIQLVRCGIIRGHGFRIVIDYNCLISGFFDRLYRMNRGIIKLHTLTDTDWAGANHNDLPSIFDYRKMKKIIDMETELKLYVEDREALYQAKKTGFSDKAVAWLWNKTEAEVFELRRKYGMFPVYKMIDTCASEFESYVPYFYF
mgnify:CR=1 FL=1